MRADPNQLEDIRIPLAVHQHQIGTEMAVAAVVVLPLHGMIHVSGRQRHVGGEQFQGFEQSGVEMPAMHTSLRAFEVAPELGGTFDCSQLPLPSAPRPKPSVVAVEFG